LAPKGCTQYFFGTDGTGTVESFNYQAGTSVHLANQDQVICVRREKNMCRICWAANASGDFRVSKGAMTATTFKGTNGGCGHGADGMGANGYDHLIIPQPVNTASTAKAAANPQSEFCGSTLFFPTAADTMGTPMVGGSAGIQSICSRSVPFQIRFLSDDYELDGDKNSQGFKLKYEQGSKCEDNFPYPAAAAAAPPGPV